jgi:hypothetical protein
MTMTTLMQASRQWATRPADERFISLHEMGAKMRDLRDRSRQTVESTRKIELFPDETDSQHRGLYLGMDAGPLAGAAMAPTHWSFGQLCSLASPGNSPASYFRDSGLPAPMIADDLNFNLRFSRKVDEVGLLAVFGEDTAVGTPGGALRAATGPNYGRVWNADVVDMLVDKFGDGISGDWRVPGEFGKKVVVDRQNTTLFASDRDMFVFLADEDRRIEVAGRNLARGFFVWNSQEGDKTLGAGFFLFDYVCCNRIVWGATEYRRFGCATPRALPTGGSKRPFPSSKSTRKALPSRWCRRSKPPGKRRSPMISTTSSPSASANAWSTRSRPSTRRRRAGRSRRCGT